MTPGEFLNLDSGDWVAYESSENSAPILVEIRSKPKTAQGEGFDGFIALYRVWDLLDMSEVKVHSVIYKRDCLPRTRMATPEEIGAIVNANSGA